MITSIIRPEDGVVKTPAIFRDSGESGARDIIGNLIDKGIAGLGRILSGVNKIMPSLLPTATAALATLSFRGTQGSFAAMSYPISLRADFYNTFGFSRIMTGSPCAKVVPIGDLTGFAQFRDVHITIQDQMLLSEAQALEEFLTAGIFLDWGGMP